MPKWLESCPSVCDAEAVWGMTAWSDQVLGRGNAIRLPPEIDPPRAPALTGPWDSPER